MIIHGMPDLTEMLLVFALGWFCCFLVAYIPYHLGIDIARWFGLFHWLYFIAGSIMTSIAIGLLFSNVPQILLNVQQPEDSRFAELPFFLLSGFAAGITCWGYLAWKERWQNLNRNRMSDCSITRPAPKEESWLFGKPIFDFEKISRDPLLKCRALWAFNLLGVWLLFLLPDNILDLVPVLATVVQFVGGFAPAVNVWGKWSNSPQLAQLFISFCILSIPVQTYIIFQHKPSWDRFVKKCIEQRRKEGFVIYSLRWFVCVFIVIALGWILLFYGVPHVPSPHYPESKPSVYKVKWAMALFGIGGAVGIGGFFAMFILCIKNLPAICSGGMKKGDHNSLNGYKTYSNAGELLASMKLKIEMQEKDVPGLSPSAQTAINKLIDRLSSLNASEKIEIMIYDQMKSKYVRVLTGEVLTVINKRD